MSPVDSSSVSKMSARAQDLFLPAGHKLDSAKPSARGSARSEHKESKEEKYTDENIEDIDPLQLEHMVGFEGKYRKTVIAMPNNENLYIKRYDSLKI